MKLSLNWIKKYVDLPDISMSKLSYDLTMCTVEVEDAVDLAESLGGLVIGRILTVEPHPDADKLRICTVDVGDMCEPKRWTWQREGTKKSEDKDRAVTGGTQPAPVGRDAKTGHPAGG